MLNTETKPARKRLTLPAQRPNPDKASSPVECAEATPAKLAPQPKAQSTARTPKASGPGPFHEWKEHRKDGAAEKILIEAKSISWLVEGQNELTGKTIIGWRNPGAGTAVLDRPFDEIFGWWSPHNPIHLPLTFLATERRIVITKDSLGGVKCREGKAVIVLRAKKAKDMPVDQDYAAVAAWIKDRPEPVKGKK